MENPSDLSICIVSYNVRDDLRTCLQSIYTHTKNFSFEILVVDNASSDQTKEMMPHEFPQVHFFPLQKNIGFAAGCNIALKASNGKYLLLLNPDTELCDQSLEKMMSFLESHAQAGIVGPQLLNPDRTLQNGLRKFPTPSVLLARYTLLKKIPFFKNQINLYRMRNKDLTVSSEVDQVSGAAMMFSRKTFNELGTLDERFFVFCEEVDYCRRAKEKKLSVCYFPEAQIIHSGGKSRKQVNNLVQIYRLESYLRYLKKYMSPPLYLSFMLLFKFLFSLTLWTECLLDIFLRIFYALIRFIHPPFRDSRKYLDWNNKSKYRLYFLKNKWLHFIAR
jgi:GT2 family glycosyltransferase